MQYNIIIVQRSRTLHKIDTEFCLQRIQKSDAEFCLQRIQKTDAEFFLQRIQKSKTMHISYLKTITTVKTIDKTLSIKNFTFHQFLLQSTQ